jgi:hypothetical protein
MDLQKVGCGSLDWIELSQDRDRWWALVCSPLSTSVLCRRLQRAKITRCCVNTIFPPEDGHVNARNMSRIIM